MSAVALSTHATLRRLLDQAAAHAPVDLQGAANPWPLGLVALASLGAADARLDEVAAEAAGLQDAAPPVDAWPAGEAWTQALGDLDAWPALRGLMREWLAQEGAAAVLGQVLPRLWPGLASAGFLGLVRTVTALEAGHAGELADALAFWVCVYTALDEGVTLDDEDEADDDADAASAADQDAADALADDLPGDEAAWPTQLPAVEPVIVLALRAAAAGADLDELVSALVEQAASHTGPTLDDLLEHLARDAARRYLREGDMLVLRLLVAAQSLRRLLDYIEADAAEREAALTEFTLAHAATLLAVAMADAALPAGAGEGEVDADPAAHEHLLDIARLAVAPRVDAGRRPLPTWAELRAAGVQRHDPELWLALWACQAQDQAHDGPEWRLAAQRALEDEAG